MIDFSKISKYLDGSQGHSRFIVMWGVLIGYAIAVLVVVCALIYSIPSPSVVTTITVSVICAPALALIANVFNKHKKGGADE